MPFHVAGGVTVPVALGEASEESELIGDRSRMFDGSMREVSDGQKKQWSITTRPLTAAAYSTLRTALLASPPIACSGDLTGSVNCFVELGAARSVKVAGEFRRILAYTLHEA